MVLTVHAVDVLFESLAEQLRGGVIGCLLTGMGRDGALGLAAIRRSGGRTVVQDEATSVVFGMPGEAMQLGAAEAVLPPEEIAQHLAAWATGRCAPVRGERHRATMET